MTRICFIDKFHSDMVLTREADSLRGRPTSESIFLKEREAQGITAMFLEDGDKLEINVQSSQVLVTEER